MNATRPLTLSALVLSLLMATDTAHAQTPVDDTFAMRQAVELLSTTLEEGLGLNERRGIFSPRAGDVRGRYLPRQGVVLEILTPLQNRGGALDTLDSSLSQLSNQLGGLLQQGAVPRPDFEAMRDQLALSMRADEASAFYRSFLQGLASQDVSAIERGLAAASDTLQSLQAIGHLDANERERLTRTLQDLRGQFAQQMQAMETLRQQVREQAAQSGILPDQSVQDAWVQARTSLEQELAALRVEVSGQMAALQLAREQAEALREQQAAQALTEFQSRLFALLCDYSAGLRALPDDEVLNVILSGVGDLLPSGERRDLLFIIEKDTLQHCQQGRMTAAELLAVSTQFQY